MSTALVTGGAGFLGSHLCEYLLDQGHRVICVDNLDTGSLQNIEHIRRGDFVFVNQDVTEHIAVDEPLDFVFHFASPASPIDYLRLPLQTLKVGSYGTHHALGLAKAKRARFMIASTSEVYGDPLVHPQQESYWGNVNPIGPRSCYDEGKRCAETLFFDYHRQHGLRIKVARIFNTYGPRMHPNDGRVVSNFIVQALRDKDVTIFGDGEQTRSFCYVDDLIRGLIAMMETGPDTVGPVNLGNPEEFSMRQLAELVLSLTGSRSKIVHRAAPADDLVSRLVEVQREAPELTDDDIAATTILLFQAGHETTTNLIAKGVLALLRQPERMAWLRAHPEASERAVEELLRFDTAVQISTKYAARDIPFHGETIRRDDPVTFVWGAINRDPAHFPDPHRLDFERTAQDHFSFGMGPNYCLGASLARLEIQQAIGALVARLPGLRLVDEVVEYKPQLHLHGLARLRVAW